MRLLAICQRSSVSVVLRGCAIAVAFAGASLTAAAAQSRDDDSFRILRAMSDYVGSQKTISFKFDSDIEVVTDQLQKIQFTSSGAILLSRPDKIRATRTGGYTDVELVSDGKVVTLYGKNIQSYAQTDAPASIDKLIDNLRDNLGVAVPGADLLLSNSFDELAADTVKGRHIGQGVIDGVECEHLAFRDTDTDWQIWIATGSKPIPVKYIITSKSVAGAPQYTLTIRDWKTDVAVAANAFTFKEPSGTKVAFDKLKGLDEVPPGRPEVADKTTGAGK